MRSSRARGCSVERVSAGSSTARASGSAASRRRARPRSAACGSPGNHPGQLYYVRELEQGRDRFLVRLLEQLAPPGGVAVDGGAHIGYLTVHLARTVGPEGRVYAFEPEAGSRAALAGNLERNEVAARVTVFPLALGAGPGRATLHVGGGGETSTLAPLEGERATAEVEVAALDDVLPQATRVDVVKLDLEGGETAALRGMRRTLDRSPSAALVVELNPGRLAALGSSQDELLALIGELGFAAQLVDEERVALVDEIAVTGEYVNLLCTRP